MRVRRGTTYDACMDGAKILVTGPTGQVAAPVDPGAGRRQRGVGRGAVPRRRRPRSAWRRPACAASRSTWRRATSASLPDRLRLRPQPGRRPRAASGTSTWPSTPSRSGCSWPTAGRRRAFLHCSSTAVYDPPDDEPRLESASLGDNHKVLFATYSISKIAGEVVVRTMARHLGLPTTIARLNVPYGDNGGWPFFHLEMMLAGMAIPVPPAGPPATTRSTRTTSSPQVPKLLAGGGGSGDHRQLGRRRGGRASRSGAPTSVRSIGREPTFVETDQTLCGVPVRPDPYARADRRRRPSDWRDGMRRMVGRLPPRAGRCRRLTLRQIPGPRSFRWTSTSPLSRSRSPRRWSASSTRTTTPRSSTSPGRTWPRSSTRPSAGSS